MLLAFSAARNTTLDLAALPLGGIGARSSGAAFAQLHIS